MQESPHVTHHSSGRKARYLLVILALLGGGVLIAARPALQAGRCFGEGDARVCIAGRFLQFWEQQGGIAAFGLPLAPAATKQTPDGRFTVQYFERARLELHPDKPAPYDVQLGRLGAEWQQTFGSQSATPPSADVGRCHLFRETGHQVCGRMLLYWGTNGLRLDRFRLVTYAESIARFGLPLGPTLSGADGETLRTQLFERAQLVERRDGTVVVAPLGQQMLQLQVQQQQSPTPTFVSTATPTPTGTAAPTVVSNPTAPSSPTPAPPTVTPTAPPTVTPAAPTLVPTAPPTAVPPPPPPEPIFIVPVPNVPCNRNVPAPANGLQMWVTDPDDNDGRDQMTVCVRLIVNGEAARGASAHLTRYHGGSTRPGQPISTGVDGIAPFIFYTGPGSPGRPSRVEAEVSFGGIAYRGTLQRP